MASDKKEKGKKAKRKEERERVKKRAREDAEQNLNKGGADYLKLPEGVKAWSPEDKADESRFPILPFIVGDDRACLSDANPGDRYYRVRFKIHRDVGPGKKRVVCLQTFGKQCPICDYFDIVRNEAGVEWKDVSHLRPSDRDLFLLGVRGEDGRELKAYDIAYSLFGELLDKKARKIEDEDGFFFFPEDNIDVSVDWNWKSFNQFTYAEAQIIEFKKRKKDLPEELIEQAEATNPVDFLIEMEFDAMKDLFHGADGYDSDDDDADGDGDEGGSDGSDDDGDGDDAEDNDNEDAGGDEGSGDDGDDDSGDGDEGDGDDDEGDGDDPDPPDIPSLKKLKKMDGEDLLELADEHEFKVGKKKRGKIDDEDEDTIDELREELIEHFDLEEEKEEKEEKKEKKDKKEKKEGKGDKKSKCPFKYKFGTDFEKKDECEDECEKWAACKKEKKGMKK